MATPSDNPLSHSQSVALSGSEAQRERLQTIGRLASGVAHDFANLVTLICGYSEIVLKRMHPLDPARAELEEIRKAAERGARLTAQLLDFARSESGSSQLVDLNQLIWDMERMLRHTIGENVELSTDCASDLGKVVADRGQIEQVIINLILNARDAMPMGGRIEIRTRNTASCPTPEGQSRAGVMLTVTDNGHGIDPEKLDQVFEPFFTTKKRGSGTGLGLNTVREIVLRSGGVVWVKSKPGEGAVFTVCLPRAESAITAGLPNMPRPGFGTETILLVEDDSSVRQLLGRILRERGYTVLEACNSEDALRVFDRIGSEIHLVLTDLVMPGLNGMELSMRLREIRPELKVVWMSGYAEDVLVNTGSLHPGMPFLRKPLRPDALVAGVREALDSPSLPFNPR